MNKLLTMASLVALSASVSISVHAQAQETASQLNLFEPVERPQAANVPQVQGPRAIDPQANGPRFTLVGTSRFGDTHRARLRSDTGEVIAVSINPDGSAPIPGYPGFRIADSGSRYLVVEHPDNQPCFASADAGVSCSGSHIARLQIATAQPVEVVAETRSNQAQGQLRRNGRGAANTMQVNGEPVEAEEVVVTSANPNNPFAAALRAARERGDPDAAVMRAEAERFRPRRIDPANLPPGTTLIRTPFGDRVVVEE